MARALKCGVVVFVFAALPAEAEESEMDLEVLRAAVESYATSIRSISARFSIASVPHEGAKRFKSPAKPWGPNHYEWAQSGDQAYLAFLNAVPPEPGYELFFDGQRGYVLLHHEQPARKNLTIVESINPGYKQRPSPASVIGWHLSVTELTLAEALAQPNARLIGEETVSGRRCWKVEMLGLSASFGRPFDLTVWLDPQHDYLPARMRLSWNTGNKRYPEGGGVREVTDFVQVLDEVSNRMRWFPKRCVFTGSRSHQTMTIEGVRLNPVIPRDGFRPQPPRGTQVHDKLKDEFYVVGGLQAVDELAEHAVQRAKQDLAADGNHSTDAAESNEPAAEPSRGAAELVDARPPASWLTSLSRVLFWLSVLVVSIGVVVWVCIQRR